MIAGIGLLYGVMHLAGITCPIKYVTGISCAGCGMTRACLALLRGNIHNAAYYHPLVFIMPAVLVLYLYRGRLNVHLKHGIVIAAVVMFLAVYIWRMADPANTIVVFNPEDGLIFRLYSLLN